MQKERNPQVNGMNFFVIRDEKKAALPAEQTPNVLEPVQAPLQSQSFPVVSEKPLDNWFSQEQVLPPQADGEKGTAQVRSRRYDPEAHRMARQRVYASRGMRSRRYGRDVAAAEHKRGPSLCSVNQIIGVAVILFGIYCCKELGPSNSQDLLAQIQQNVTVNWTWEDIASLWRETDFVEVWKSLWP